ncbi:MAG TPA: TetR/AcrR family transcriptional regulator [Actinomycetes bacterium]|nr:TetR/AcrR family transcriptional regulator [Actinomycetes bacterium]
MASRTPLRGARNASEPAPRTELSRRRILDAAQALIEREGDRALTFRRLGAELGVDPTAAYRHFRNKDDLLLALGDRLLGEAIDAAVAETPGNSGWRERMRLAAHSIRNTLVRHPNLAQLISVRITQGEHEALGIEATLATLAQTGLPTREIVAIQRAFADTVLAWSSFSATFDALPAEAKARDTAAWVTTYRTLPAADFPHIHAASPYLDEFDDAFDIALDLMFDGIEARIAAHEAPKAREASDSSNASTPARSQETE